MCFISVCLYLASRGFISCRLFPGPSSMRSLFLQYFPSCVTCLSAGFHIFLPLCIDMNVFQLSVPAKQVTPKLSDLKQQRCGSLGGSCAGITWTPSYSCWRIRWPGRSRVASFTCVRVGAGWAVAWASWFSSLWPLHLQQARLDSLHRGLGMALQAGQRQKMQDLLKPRFGSYMTPLFLFSSFIEIQLADCISLRCTVV